MKGVIIIFSVSSTDAGIRLVTLTALFLCRNLLHFSSLSKSINQKLRLVVFHFLQTSFTASEIDACAQLAHSIASKACTLCSFGKYIQDCFGVSCCEVKFICLLFPSLYNTNTLNYTGMPCEIYLKCYYPSNITILLYVLYLGYHLLFHIIALLLNTI